MVRLEVLEERFWERHSNPKSGWSRVFVLPALLYAVYRRNWKLSGLVLVFVALNPLLFSPPADDSAWMTRVVLAERWWIREHERNLFGTSYPDVVNLLNVPVVGYAFLAALWKQPIRTAIACAVSMGLKFWYVGSLVRRYDATESQSA